jgi:uncharacterized protein (TIGR03435 family)
LVVAGATVVAQSDDSGAVTFTQLSIKPSRGVNSSFASDDTLRRFATLGGTTMGLITGGYSTTLADVIGPPTWVSTERFDIRAAWSAPFNRSTSAMRTLLTQRFGFAAHYEMVEAPAFALTVASRDGTLGPGIRRVDVVCPTGPSARQDPHSDTPPASGVRSKRSADREGVLMRGNGVTMDFLARMFSVADRPIVDRTGLAGRFDFGLAYRRQYKIQQNPDGTVAFVQTDPSPAHADLSVALSEQLGLGLEPITMTKKVLVIDHSATGHRLTRAA